MPTNKLWIEHTERAAWDSVEALRESLAKSEARLQALAPSVHQLPDLLDALERAREQLKLDVSVPAEVVGRMLSRIQQHAAELESVRQTVPVVMDFSAPPFRPPLDSDEPDRTSSDALDDDPEAIEDFTRAMRRHEIGVGRSLPHDLNRLLALAETKVDDLAELEGSELRDAALDLALIAVRVHAASRSKA